MNRIKRIAAAAALGAAVLPPAVAAIAYAGTATEARMDQSIHREQQYMLYRQRQDMQEFRPSDEQLLRQEQLYMQDQQWPEPATVDDASDAATAAAGFSWETAGFMTLGAVALAAGSAIVVRRSHRAPKHA
ncbi:MAG TPA: hypothetical protein VIQ02_14810 [Jiangellaceae bacterium]